MCVGGWRDGSRLTCDNDYFTVGRPLRLFLCMVKFFIQLYSSDDYFVWFYCIGDRPRRRRRRVGEGREGFNSNIKRIIPALFVLQFERNWICPLLYPGSIRFRGCEFYDTKSKIWLFQNFVSLFSVDYIRICVLLGRKYLEFERLNVRTNIKYYLFNSIIIDAIGEFVLSLESS